MLSLRREGWPSLNSGCQPRTLRTDRLLSFYAISWSPGGAEMSGKILQLRQAKLVRTATSRSKGRRGNDAYQIMEHLTEAEMDNHLPPRSAGLRGLRSALG